MLHTINELVISRRIPCLSTKPPRPALACEKGFLVEQHDMHLKWANGLLRLHLAYICVLFPRDSICICSHEHILNVKQGYTLSYKTEQCPNRVRVGVLLRPDLREDG